MTSPNAPLRILVCTKRDLVGCLVLNRLLPSLADCHVRVLLSNKTRAAEMVVPELAELKFFERDLPLGTVFPLVDALGGGGRLATFAGLARRFGVAVDVVEDINGPASVALVREFAPDAILSIRFSLIFKRVVFDIPRFGTFNVHPGALPRHAGLFAPFHCMLDGESWIGSTLHQVDSGIDSGPVIGIGELPIEPSRSLQWHVLNAYQPGIDLFLAMIAAWRRGDRPKPEVQDFNGRRYRSMPDAAAFAEFRARGFKLADPAEIGAILADFLPPGVALGPVGDDGGAPCCYAPA